VLEPSGCLLGGIVEKNHKILIVDDDPEALLLMEEILNMYGYDVRQLIQTAIKEKPDLISLDIMMPELDGYTALEKSRKEEAIKNIPVVMVTALDREDNKKLASSLGASGYITKPINSKHLIEMAASFIPN
jgi:DNA-binding response OmpR family regulator